MYNLVPLTKYTEGKVLNEAEILKLGIDICSALEASSAQHIIHCDLSPEKIFVDESGNFVLANIGISSGEYTAPEVRVGAEYDERADIYSLGLILYFLLNNSILPSPDELTAHPRNASPELGNILLFACNPDPQRRFRSAAALKTALISYAEPLRSSVVPPAPMPIAATEDIKPKRKKGKIALLIAIIALICAITAGGTVLLIKDPFGWFTSVIETPQEDKDKVEEAASQANTDEPTLEKLEGYWVASIDSSLLMEYAVAEAKAEVPDSQYVYDPGSAPPWHIIFDITEESTEYYLIIDETVDIMKSVLTVMIDCMVASPSVRYVLSAEDIEMMYEEVENTSIEAMFNSDDEIIISEGIFINADTSGNTAEINGNIITIYNLDERYTLEYKGDSLVLTEYEDLNPEDDDEYDENFTEEMLLGLEFKRLTEAELNEWKSTYKSYTEDDLKSEAPSQNGGNYLPL